MAFFDIATLGTSLTAGNASDATYHFDLGRALVPGKSDIVRIYNFGVGGGNINDGLARLSTVLGTRAKVCLIEYTTNDCSTDIYGNITQSECLSKTTSLCNSLKAAGITPFLMTMNPMAGAGVAASARTALATYNQIYRNIVAGDATIKLIDMYPLWGSPTTGQIPDGVHPPRAQWLPIEIPAMRDALLPYLS